jgi:pimeloyl-ACP methyl ester carboxylesterase
MGTSSLFTCGTFVFTRFIFFVVWFFPDRSRFMRNTLRLDRRHHRLIIALIIVAAFFASTSPILSFFVRANARAESERTTAAPSVVGFMNAEGGALAAPADAAVTNPAPSHICNDEGNACLWEEDSTALGCRIPLIFVHGIHGNEITSDDPSCYQTVLSKKLVKRGESIDDPLRAPNKCYFNSLIAKVSAAAKPALTKTYKIFRYHYKSDVNPVQDIGIDLGVILDRYIAQDANFDKEFMIVAHSMGGLVSRAYMNLYRHHAGGSNSRWKGKPAGERVMKLITLGTPHHGSQLSNGLARTQDSYLGGSWSAVFRGVDYKVWGALACVTYAASCLGKANRADLHWDDYNGAWTKLRSSYRNNPIEQNSLLAKLSTTTYDNKIYPYFGYLGDGKKSARSTDLIDFGKRNPASLVIALSNNQHLPNQHKGLVAAGVVLERIDEDNFAFSLPGIPAPGLKNLFNDGFVTMQSASFSGRADLPKVRSCLGYDHMEMRDGASYSCKGNGVEKPLAQFVANDLYLESAPACPRIVISTSLAVAPNKGPYSVGQAINGTFTVINRGTTEVDTRQILIAGRVAGDCPNDRCPDFTIRDHIKLAPGKSYSYTGNFTPSVPGSYTFKVAYQTPEGNWVMPVDTEKGTINSLGLMVQYPPPTLTSSTPSSLSAGPKDQMVHLTGTGLSRILYCYLQYRNQKGIYIYIPLAQVKGRSDTQMDIKTKFTMPGPYHISAFTMDKGHSNLLAIDVR